MIGRRPRLLVLGLALTAGLTWAVAGALTPTIVVGVSR